MKHNFRKLEIYQESIALAKLIFEITLSFPENEQFGLTSQLKRASVSVPSNISEGSSRNSSKEFSRFLSYSLGSLFEIETQLFLAKEFNYISEEKQNEIIDLIIKLQKRITIFKSKIEKE